MRIKSWILHNKVWIYRLCCFTGWISEVRPVTCVIMMNGESNLVKLCFSTSSSSNKILFYVMFSVFLYISDILTFCTAMTKCFSCPVCVIEASTIYNILIVLLNPYWKGFHSFSRNNRIGSILDPEAEELWWAGILLSAYFSKVV